MKTTKLELIGLKAEVIDSSNKSLIGLKGRIIDETKNTLSIEKKDGLTRKILKKEVTFEVLTEKGKITLKGVDLIGKPIERVKKRGIKPRW